MAKANPAVATRESETIEAMKVPAMAHTARVSSAPKRRNHLNPYTAATALPAGSELVRACDATVILNRGKAGGRTPPLVVSSSYSMTVKLANDSASAVTAAGTHHQLRWSNTVVIPESSSV